MYRQSLVFFAVISLCLACLSAVHAQRMEPLPPGMKAPGFTVRTLDGKRLTLNSLRGKVVLIDYWATWCGPCRMAMPMLKALDRQFHKQGLVVIGMDVDEPNTTGQVGPFVKHFGLSYTISSLSNQHAQMLADYNVGPIPSEYVIDKKGIIRWSLAGYDQDVPQQLTLLIKRLLAEKK